MNSKKIILESEINYHSYNMILFNKKLAYYYINTGFLPNITIAQNILRETIRSFEIGNFHSPEQYDSYFQLKLLLALSYEFFDEHNIAYSLYEDNLTEIENEYGFVDNDLINLHKRLMYIISADKMLEKSISNYNGFNQFVLYQNKRRIIEKKIQNDSVKENEIIELNNLFNSIKLSMDRLYYVTHYRLLFHYYKKRGEYELANSFYSDALNMANEYEFTGQVVQLRKLKRFLE